MANSEFPMEAYIQARRTQQEAKRGPNPAQWLGAGLGAGIQSGIAANAKSTQDKIAETRKANIDFLKKQFDTYKLATKDPKTGTLIPAGPDVEQATFNKMLAGDKPDAGLMFVNPDDIRRKASEIMKIDTATGKVTPTGQKEDLLPGDKGTFLNFDSSKNDRAAGQANSAQDKTVDNLRQQQTYLLNVSKNSLPGQEDDAYLAQAKAALIGKAIEQYMQNPSAGVPVIPEINIIQKGKAVNTNKWWNPFDGDNKTYVPPTLSQPGSPAAATPQAPAAPLAGLAKRASDFLIQNGKKDTPANRAAIIKKGLVK